MYKMYLGIGLGEEGFILPILPEKIEFNESGNNKTYDIINLGEVNSINLPKLTEISFESFFPKYRAPYVGSKQLFEPSFYISKIREWREQNLKIRLIFIGSPLKVNDLFTIEDFKFYEQAGEVGDVYYSIDLKRYRPHFAKKVIIVSNDKTNIVKKTIGSRTVEKAKSKTHTVINGDTLFHIAKKYLGDGSRWKEIYNLNKDKLKNSEPIHPIYPGQILKLP
ncbi:LysM repeat protein [Clostridium pascui]|uniref:LysM peptidoglycan-binding domain-containing protein n=1 Tax=Clostridium pascui TaxID=46609 RepID=UPI001956CACC|nr:LysM peptidoglycan-binding domain-containing protein [Clostridium pascui]MBM7868880.1 LysM repeat protein [Clostridium pascui]